MGATLIVPPGRPRPDGGRAVGVPGSCGLRVLRVCSRSAVHRTATLFLRLLATLFLLPAAVLGQDVSSLPHGTARVAPSSLSLPASSEAAPANLRAQDPDQPGRSGGTAARFLLGAASGLGVHECGHLLFDGVFGVQPVLKRVDFGGLPFVAISHQADVSGRKEFAISSAGFWMQHLSSEIVLTRHPELREERAPFLKGMLAFNVLASAAYGTAALARVGPFERDTRAMAAALRTDERWIAALVLVPAALDAWRYFHPQAAWAKWLSRGAKVGGVVLIVR
jgi:hypothetical protein